MSIIQTGSGISAKQGAVDVIDGRYELCNPVGHGGMGTVYRAKQRPIDREVAVKILRRSSLGEDGPRAVRRFFKEARAIASLHHPNIISLYDFGQAESGDLFLVMELLPGKSLGDLIHRERKIELHRAVHILDQVLDALEVAHASGIVHRDLKPDNIQIGKRGSHDDFVTVLDFGIARKQDVDGHAKADNTTIEVCGTPAYMSPEQILGTAIDPRSDVYACGVLLFEMLTGQLPFDHERTIDIYLGHLKQKPPRIKDVAPHLTAIPGLQELFDRLLAKEVGDRMPDAASFRRALGGITGVQRRSQQQNTGNGPTTLAEPAGYELVATVEPKRTRGLDDLMQQWALDVAQHGGTVREREPGTVVAIFQGLETPTAVIQCAMSMKRRTKMHRLSTLSPLYIRVGIHSQPALATRLCEEAPRGGLVIGADCVNALLARHLAKGRLRLEPAGEVRVRGFKTPIRMMQLLTSR